MIRYTLTAIATGTALLFSPVLAGGPVLVEDDFVAEARPSSEGRWVVPVIVILGIGLALASKGSGSDAVCNGDEQPTPEPGLCQ